MRLDKKYAGIQFFAPATPHRCTMYFDSHISKVYSSAGTYGNYNYTEAEWTQSGQSVASNYDYQRTYVVTLDAGYQIDTVTIGGETATSYEPVISEDRTSFSGEFSYGGEIDITITSKYVGGGGTTMKSVDITTLPNYESIPLGTHKLTVTAQADGYTDSDPSAEVTFINGYALTVQHDNCAYSPHSSMIAVFDDTVLTFVANANYNLPDTVTVTGASHTWDKSTGKLTITNVTGGVAVTVTATQPQLATPQNVSADGTVLSWDAVENAESYDIYAGETLIGNTDGGGYSITVNVTNGTYSGDSRVLPGGTATVTITANEGYELPDTITVTGATGAWNKTTGTLSISNPTGNVTVSGECVEEAYFVTIPKVASGDSGYGFYSTDNGSTWMDLFNSDVGSVSAKTIRFKAVGDEWWACYISSDTLGMSLSPYHETKMSENYTLTKNITDLSFYYSGQ